MNHSKEVTGRPLLLAVKAAAAHLGVSASMIRTLQERGTLPKIKLTHSVKGQVYTTLAAVEALAMPAPAPVSHAADVTKHDVANGVADQTEPREKLARFTGSK